jgi:hypothetical protein
VGFGYCVIDLQAFVAASICFGKAFLWNAMYCNVGVCQAGVGQGIFGVFFDRCRKYSIPVLNPSGVLLFQ